MPRKRDVLAGSGPDDPGTGGQAAADPEAAARQVCLRLLTMAPRTRGQLEDALRKRGIPDEAAATVLERLAETGLIDDAVFAKAWVESRHHRRGLSRRTLSAELHQRGVDDEAVREAVETLSPEQEIATARELAAKKLAGTPGQPADARVRRVAGLLARKGYPPGLAFRVIREAMEREGESQSHPVHDGRRRDEDHHPGKHLPMV